MQISIKTSSVVPIYEQIVQQIKQGIMSCELRPGSVLPSVRALAKELEISALTVKKAYDYLEQEGLLVVSQGKGTFVAETNHDVLRENQQKEVENDMEAAVGKGIKYGLSLEEIRTIFDMIMEEQDV